MHPEHGAIFRASREKLLTSDSASHNIAHKRVALGQVGSEIHFLPFVPLFYAEPREAEV